MHTGKWTIIVLAVLGFGALRLPLERSLDARRRAAGLRDDAIASLTLGEQGTQASLIAVLGGLRSLVAAIWDLRACSSWEKTNYAQVEKEYRFCQRLQPKLLYYWDRGQWMMATNAASYYRHDDRNRGPLAEVVEQAFIEKGLQMVKEGQRFLPRDYRIYEAEAMLYNTRIKPRQPLREYEAWSRAAACPDAPLRNRRYAAYALAHVPGRETDALREIEALYHESPVHRVRTLVTLHRIYEIVHDLDDWMKSPDHYRELRQLYEFSPVNRTPLLISTLQLLERRLGIPPWDGIPLDGGSDDF
jgi:hypothetical protein